MDVASGIIGIAAAGVQLSTALYNYASSVANAGKDMEEVAGDVALTANVLSSVGSFLQDEHNVAVASANAIADARKILVRSESTFQEIRSMVEKKDRAKEDGKKRLSTFTKATWPFKGSRLELLKRRLESLKTSLLLFLKILSFARDRANGTLVAATIREESQSIRQLHERHQKSLQEIVDLQTRMHCLSVQQPTVESSNQSAKTIGVQFPAAPAVDSGFAESSTTLSRSTTLASASVSIHLTPNDGEADNEYSNPNLDQWSSTATFEAIRTCIRHIEALRDQVCRLQHAAMFKASEQSNYRSEIIGHYQSFRSEFEAILHSPLPHSVDAEQLAEKTNLLKAATRFSGPADYKQTEGLHIAAPPESTLTPNKRQRLDPSPTDMVNEAAIVEKRINGESSTVKDHINREHRAMKVLEPEPANTEPQSDTVMSTERVPHSTRIDSANNRLCSPATIPPLEEMSAVLPSFPSQSELFECDADTWSQPVQVLQLLDTASIQPQQFAAVTQAPASVDRTRPTQVVQLQRAVEPNSTPRQSIIAGFSSDGTVDTLQPLTSPGNTPVQSPSYSPQSPRVSQYFSPLMSPAASPRMQASRTQEEPSNASYGPRMPFTPAEAMRLRTRNSASSTRRHSSTDSRPWGEESIDHSRRALSERTGSSQSLNPNLLSALPGSSTLTSRRTSHKITTHKIAEQGRRNRVNTALRELDALVPGERMPDNSGVVGPKAGVNWGNSKAAVVERAVAYIRRLQPVLAFSGQTFDFGASARDLDRLGRELDGVKMEFSARLMESPPARKRKWVGEDEESQVNGSATGGAESNGDGWDLDVGANTGEDVVEALLARWTKAC